MNNKCESCLNCGTDTIALGVPVAVCIVGERMDDNLRCPGYVQPGDGYCPPNSEGFNNG